MARGRFILVIIDSLGVGAMTDVSRVRPQDRTANTAMNIIKVRPDINIPTLLKLGLMNSIGCSYQNHKPSASANWGTADLAHDGADSFMGHQELMGSKPKPPVMRPFIERIDAVEARLIASGYKVTRFGKHGLPQVLVLNDSVTIGDNLEADPGHAYNVTACLDLISFEDLKKIGDHVRSCADVSRVICFGGKRVVLSDLLGAIQVKSDKIIGVDAPLSGVYNYGYRVIHLGYGINPQTQVPTILERAGIDTALFGKSADIISANYAYKYPAVDSKELFNELEQKIAASKSGFFCMTVQETDIAGHLEDVNRYTELLELCDSKLAKLIAKLNHDDILIVTADHGNDPTVRHSSHTRERVPILMHSQKTIGKHIGHRKTLADVGATVAAYFDVSPPEFGCPFFINEALRGD